jgi:hypothetical protein
MNCFEFIYCEGSWLLPLRWKAGFFYEPMKMEIGTFVVGLLEDVHMGFHQKLQNGV